MQEKKSLNGAFIVSVILTLAVCVWGIALPESFGAAANGSMRFLTSNFSWPYCSSMTLFVLFCVWIGFFSKYKNIKLGADDSKPEYSNIAWFSMLFSAGMVSLVKALKKE